MGKITNQTEIGRKMRLKYNSPYYKSGSSNIQSQSES